MSHFYKPDGTFVDGLRAARKISPLPLPSPSTVLGMLGSFGLTQYFRRQMFEASLSTPRNPDWTDEQFYSECEKWSDQHGQIAMDKGSEFHSLFEQHNLARKFGKPLPTPPDQWKTQFESLVKWFDENISEIIAVESVMVGDGYAGRADLVCRLKGGRIATVDAKSQGLKKAKRFNHYLKWALQLSAYSFPVNKAWKSDTLISLCVGSDCELFEAYEWPEKSEYYHKLFLSVVELWRLDNDYFPLPDDIIP